MAAIKVQRGFMHALNKHCSIFTVVLGRTADPFWMLRGVVYTPFSRRGWHKEFNRTQKGNGTESCKGSQTEVRNAGVWLGHMEIRQGVHLFLEEREHINSFYKIKMIKIKITIIKIKIFKGRLQNLILSNVFIKRIFGVTATCLKITVYGFNLVACGLK